MKREIRISHALFYIPYIMWIAIYSIQQSYYRDIIDINSILSLVRSLTYVFLLVKLLYDDAYSIKSIIAFILIIFIIVICKNTGLNVLLDTVLFIYSARNIKLKEIIKITFKLQIVIMLFIIISCFIGILPNEVLYDGARRVRHGLGYRYTTFSANFYFHIILMFFYINQGKKIKNNNRIIILLTNYIIYYLTDTKAVFILVFGIVLSEYIINSIDISIKKTLYNKIIFKYSFIISAIVSIFFSITYNSGNILYQKLNQAFTNRLMLGQRAYEEYGISFFGNRIMWNTSSGYDDIWGKSLYNYVDSAYLQIMLNYGVILLILICIGYTYIAKWAMDANQKNICLVLLFLAVHSITDPQLIELRYNPFLLLFAIFFHPSIKISKERNFVIE